jgi:hypothetical protein
MKAIVLLLTVSLPLFAQTITYSEKIAPIIYSRCTGCHRPGEAAPFSLITYEDVAKRGKLIAAVTKSRYMPPWKAEPASYSYRDSRRLSDQELETLQSWVKNGMPQGDPAKTPALPKFPAGWQLGTPDLVVEMPKGFTVYAEGPDIYRNIVIPLELTEDKWLQAVELRPSARTVVHHVLYFADSTGDARRAEATQTEAQANGMKFTRGMVGIGGMAIGAQPHMLPNGLALKLEKGSDLVFQYHFHPTGKVETEKSVVGLYFAKKAPEHTLVPVLLPPTYGLFSGIEIPPGTKDYRVHDSFVLPVDCEAISVGAHAHYIAKTMNLTATLPDGQVKTLLAIKDWDFSWQDRYFFQDAVSLPKGTRLDGDVTWDNSEENTRNPSHPPIRVVWGEESKDEMGSVGLQLIPRVESDLKELQTSYRQHAGQIVRQGIMQDPGLITRIRQKFGIDLMGGRSQQ